MYKKAMSFLVVGSFLFFSCLICARGIDAAYIYEKPAECLKLEFIEQKAGEITPKEEVRVETKGLGIADIAVSDQRVVGCFLLEKEYVHKLSEEELEVLLRIVEAEAGCEDEDGKLLVANVVLNRVGNEQFPDTVTEVVFQKENGVTQFSPVANGRYYEVVVSEETYRAVNRALMGEDISGGALYFAARAHSDGSKMKWFDENLTRLFAHGGHEFFK